WRAEWTLSLPRQRSVRTKAVRVLHPHARVVAGREITVEQLLRAFTQLLRLACIAAQRDHRVVHVRRIDADSVDLLQRIRHYGWVVVLERAHENARAGGLGQPGGDHQRGLTRLRVARDELLGERRGAARGHRGERAERLGGCLALPRRGDLLEALES